MSPVLESSNIWQPTYPTSIDLPHDQTANKYEGGERRHTEREAVVRSPMCRVP